MLSSSAQGRRRCPSVRNRSAISSSGSTQSAGRIFNAAKRHVRCARRLRGLYDRDASGVMNRRETGSPVLVGAA